MWGGVEAPEELKEPAVYQFAEENQFKEDTQDLLALAKQMIADGKIMEAI